MQKSYYAIIPANVRYDKELTANAKLLYGEITALCNETGNCWASNKYFAELYGVSKVSVSKWVSQLVEKGYIKSVVKYKRGSKEIDHRYLSILGGGIKEKFKTPIKEKFKDNTTSYNNTVNIKTSKDVFNKLEDEFNTFYSLYPKKIAKKAALAKWKSIKPPLDQCIKTLNAWIPKWAESDKQFTPSPDVWLNKGRWEDEPPEIKQKPVKQDNFKAGGINFEL